MLGVNVFCLIGITLTVLPSTLGVPIFWFFPWNTWIPSSSSSSSSGSSSSSSSSSSTARSPVNATISIGNRMNTSALDDFGTVINGLTITRNRRSVPLILKYLPKNNAAVDQRERTKRSPQEPTVSSESVIQIGNQIIRLPPGNLSNLTISIIDGTPYVEANPTIAPANNGSVPGLFGRIKSFFDELFNKAN